MSMSQVSKNLCLWWFKVLVVWLAIIMAAMIHKDKIINLVFKESRVILG